MRPILLRPLVAIALLGLAACAPNPPPQAEAPAAPVVVATPVSSMQARMDRFDVPFRVPRTGKAILVNLPAFELIAIENGEEVFRSPIVIGAPGGPDTETPLVDSWVSVVRFRPTWRPTPTMVRSGEYEARTWPAGKGNPLGLAAIRLQPGMLVYLHDTNRKKLFERDMRALSHGCVRVQRWDEVIAWLQGISLEEVHRYANGSRTFDMPADPVPVYFRYYRAFPDADGRLRTFDDVYRIGPSSDPAPGLSVSADAEKPAPA